MKNVQNTIRAEGVERAVLTDLHSFAPTEFRERLGLDLGEVGGALVSVASRKPTILVNRTVGLGLAHPADRETVENIVERYRNANVRRYFLQLDPAASPKELPDWLEAAGLEPYQRAWAKFERGTDPAPEAKTDLKVREIGLEHAQDFGRIAAAGFELDDAWIPVLAELVGRNGWHVYMCFDGDQPAGCGAMRIHDGVAWLDWAATLPEFRRRGSQGALISRRISDGIAFGCDTFSTSTGEDVDGDAQHSYHNIERYGFRRTHARANWVPTKVKTLER
jgi:GNAT superfamily N-acetyltransferase